ncbi:hypothetical protein [Pararhizobium arenae]|uniref:hypothetical protein n=1 Tax=Pararhizobium arenae TaxID=1856850 RepID=UPI00094AAEF7|nr:hypothetical protein [Pararhizobium arenae]
MRIVLAIKTAIEQCFKGLFSVLCMAGAVTTATAQPTSAKVALVITSDVHASEDAERCSTVGRDIAAAFEGVGYDVVTVIGGTSIATREALQTFRRKLEGGGKLAFTYLCGPAAIVGERIFLLPSDLNTAGSYRLETQAIVVTAILKAMTGAESTLLGDLSSVGDEGARKDLRRRVDAADILTILSFRKESGGSVGRAFAGAFPRLGSEWLATSAVAEKLGQAGLRGAILSLPADRLPSTTQANEGNELDIAIVPVPVTRPLIVSAESDLPKAKAPKPGKRAKVRAQRKKEQTKQKSGFLEFFKSNRQIRE